MKSSLKTKIEALSMKTVANGATLAEEQSAKLIIKRLLGSAYADPAYAPKAIPQTKVDVTKDLEFYNNCWSNGTVELNIPNINWDAVAKQYLNGDNWEEYIHQTSAAWEQRYSPSHKYKIGDAEYRRFCSRVYRKLSIR